MEKQRWAGVDIANDGEQGRVGFQTYVPKRMSGFGGESKRPFGKEWVELPLFTEKFSARIAQDRKSIRLPRMRRRAQISRQGSHQDRAGSLQAPGGRGEAAVPRDVLRRAVTGDHRDDDAQCALFDLRGLSRRDRPRDALRIQVRGRRRIDPADRRAGSGDGTGAPVPGQIRRGIRQDHRAAHRRAQQSAAGNSARSRAAAHLLGQLGRAAYLRHRPRAAAAGVLPGQCRRL